jgi:hypothetical protein
MKAKKVKTPKTSPPADRALTRVMRSPAWERTYRDHKKLMPKKRSNFGT